ncbi:MAG: heavy metal-binding domain-containing protein [Agitococcus sp.]|nr:heavy metal-binding domain-containing protein [Agitococcus sp.]
MGQQLICRKCGRLNRVSDNNCWKCKEPITDEDRRPFTEETENRDALIKEAKKTGDWSAVPDTILEYAAKDIVLTTSCCLASRTVSQELGVIATEVVYGMNIFSDLFAGIRDIVGGRSGAVQKVLKDAKKVVFDELRKEALILNADAVIAIHLSYQELSGGGKNGMIMLVASGTAVKTEMSGF